MVKKADSILILSTGGTFNKIYDPLTGELKVDSGESALESLASKWLCRLEWITLIGKDSLEMDDRDRKEILRTIRENPGRKILVIHGTDTMERTARYLAERIGERSIVLTGAMIPYSIDPVEATANFALGLGYLLGSDRPGVYLAMHGQVSPWNRLTKNRTLGRFQPAEAF